MCNASEYWKLLKTAGTEESRPKQMERYTQFVAWKCQYRYNIVTVTI